MKFCTLCRRAAPNEASACSHDECPLTDRSDIRPWPGETVGGYRILEVIAAGSAGTVYKATKGSSQDKVALKLLSDDLSSSTSVIHRIRRESKNAIKLASPHVAGVMDCGDHQGRFYIVREWLEGHPLSVVMRDEGPMQLKRAISIAYQICSALELVHRVRLVHRDLKPNHVFLSQSGESWKIKLIDIGVSAKIYALQSKKEIFGTPGYLAPEQAEGGLVNLRSDLYSLGCIIYQMIVGRAPFTGSPQGLVDKHTSVEAPRISQSLPEIPSSLDSLVAKMLSKQITSRPISASAIQKELVILEPTCTEPLEAPPLAARKENIRDDMGMAQTLVDSGISADQVKAAAAAAMKKKPSPARPQQTSSLSPFQQRRPRKQIPRSEKATMLGMPVIDPETAAAARQGRMRPVPAHPSEPQEPSVIAEGAETTPTPVPTPAPAVAANQDDIDLGATLPNMSADDFAEVAHPPSEEKPPADREAEAPEPQEPDQPPIDASETLSDVSETLPDVSETLPDMSKTLPDESAITLADQSKPIDPTATLPADYGREPKPSEPEVPPDADAGKTLPANYAIEPKTDDTPSKKEPQKSEPTPPREGVPKVAAVPSKEKESTMTKVLIGVVVFIVVAILIAMAVIWSSGCANAPTLSSVEALHTHPISRIEL